LFSVIIVGLAFGPITLILSHLALTKMPKDGRNARFITQMVLILGILATLGLLVVLFLLLGGFITDYVFFALAIITIILAIIIAIIAFSIRMNYLFETE
jgi:L-asparagine transporter-like permease